jgi:hypothetical protein
MKVVEQVAPGMASLYAIILLLLHASYCVGNGPSLGPFSNTVISARATDVALNSTLI